ncbi:MAG: GNAT family N-acetyltransferase [Pseudomonadota bacterium]
MKTQAAAPIRVRLARTADAAAILALEESFPGDRMSARSVRRFLASPSACVYVAAVGGATVGALVLLLRRNMRWARVYSVVVHPRYRGRGLGRRLIRAAEAAARRSGRRGVSLEVRADNAPARGLYRSLGYMEDEQLPGYYEDGAPGVRLRKPFGLRMRN